MGADDRNNTVTGEKKTKQKNIPVMVVLQPLRRQLERLGEILQRRLEALKLILAGLKPLGNLFGSQPGRTGQRQRKIAREGGNAAREWTGWCSVGGDNSSTYVRTHPQNHDVGKQHLLVHRCNEHRGSIEALLAKVGLLE